MKRVKIMLSAILVLAVVAGALAFKAKKENGFCLYTTTLNPQQQVTCALAPNVSYVITPIGTPKNQVFSTKALDCPDFTPIAKCTLTLITKPE